MKSFFLLVTIILSFNLFAQKTLSGGGLLVTFTDDLKNMTVKWSNTNNKVVTKSAICIGLIVVNYEEYIQYKVKNSTDYFLIKTTTTFFGGWALNVDYYNELGSLYWAELVFE